MTPEEFIDTAERLLCEPASEADRRSAISRSYYGAFHACIASIPREYTPARDRVMSSESHRAVVDALTGWGARLVSGRTVASQVSRELAVLKKARRHADYDLTRTLNERDVGSCVRQSRKIVTLIRYARERHDQSALAGSG
ncbi:hypothetical protein [Paraburkholderia sp. J94]|uniref:hypothetical protein n=1 Tax=Paraburkholderia sp. J94 TaxID=2805441 RepID=UPI002AB093FC|nr:hypothetical protein [Paraburkholderia sp. J94]